MAADYVETIHSGQSCLVVSPTHSEGRKVTAEIRRQLQQAGKLGLVERVLPTLENTGLTTAQRRDPAQFGEDAVLVFHQNAKGGFRRGQRLKVAEALPLPLDQAERYQVYRQGQVKLA